MVYVVNFHTNATSKRWHLWEIDLGFVLNSTPGWLRGEDTADRRRARSGVGRLSSAAVGRQGGARSLHLVIPSLGIQPHA